MRTLRPTAAEFLGTAFLLAVVVGSGIMGERLSGGNVAIALLANSIATGTGLYALIQTFGPVSGAHFNPLVSLVMARRGDLSWGAVPGYVVAQCAGAYIGVLAAHGMFGLPLLEVSLKARPGLPLLWSEVVATAGLLVVILQVSKSNPMAVAGSVGCYIAAAYWFTASTAFANPAVAVARAFTDTFAGIAPQDLPGYLAGEGIAAVLVIAALVPRKASVRSGRDVGLAD